MQVTKSLWGATAVFAVMLLATAPLEAKGGGGAATSNGNVEAGGSGDIGGGGNAQTSGNTNATNKKANGNANGNASGGGKATNGKAKAQTTSNTTVTAKNKNGRLTVEVEASGGAEAQGNNAQAGGGATLKAKAVGGTSSPKATTSVSGSTKVVGNGGKIKVLNGTPVYVDNKGRVIAKVACDGGACSGIIATKKKVTAWSGYMDFDGDFKASDLYAATKTAGYVTATATRRSVSGRGSFFAGAFSGGGNSQAHATSRTSAFATVLAGGPKKKVTVSRTAESSCSTNAFLKDLTNCSVRVRGK